MWEDLLRTNPTAMGVCLADRSSALDLKRQWNGAPRPPLQFICADVGQDFLINAPGWVGQLLPAVWHLGLPFSLPDALRILECFIEHGRETLAPAPQGSLIVIHYVAASGRLLSARSSSSREVLSSEGVSTTLGSIRERCVRELRSLMDRLVEQGLSLQLMGEYAAFSGTGLEGIASNLYENDDMINILYDPSGSLNWGPEETGSLMGCALMRLTPAASHSGPQFVEAPNVVPLPSLLVEGEKRIFYRGNIFTSKPGPLLEGFGLLRNLESVAEFPVLLDIAPVIHYLFSRLQTWNTNLDHQEEWEEIRYPLEEADMIFDDRALVIFTKLCQSLKTAVSVVVAWTYCFIRGFVVSIALRSVGCRATGLVGLSTKGTEALNELLRSFLEDIRDELSRNDWNIDEVHQLVSLKVHTDSDLKWGQNGNLRRTAVYDDRRIIQLDNAADRLARTPGSCFVFPANVTGVDFFCDILARTRKTNKAVFINDEADEFVSSVKRNRTHMERACYPSGAADPSAGEQWVETDLSELGDELAPEDLFRTQRLRAIPHIWNISATPIPLLFTDTSAPLHFTEMSVAPNYIGFETPDHCVSRIEVLTDIPLLTQPTGRASADAFWEAEGPVLESIVSAWDEDISSWGGEVPDGSISAALVITSFTTSKIVHQSILAECIVKMLPGCVAIVNNSHHTMIFLPTRFSVLRTGTLSECLRERTRRCGLTLRLGSSGADA